MSKESFNLYIFYNHNMKRSKPFFKKSGFIGVFLFLSAHILAQTAIEPNGNGTETNPYQIETLSHLYWLSNSNTIWDKHFIQTADISASSTEFWDDGKGFSPIGDSAVPFSGTYNGSGHIIDGLSINRQLESEVGLFGNIGCNGARIENLGVINVDIEGKTKTGALAGIIGNVDVEKCYTTGRVTDSAFAGGLVGINNNGKIKDCYSTVNVVTVTGVAGGLAGVNSGAVIHSYSTGRVSGMSDVGGIIGKRKDTTRVYNCFWDVENSGVKISNGGTGLTTAQMQGNTIYLRNNWDFVFEETNGKEDIWARHDAINNGYPLFAWQSPFPVKENLPSIVGEGNVSVNEIPAAIDISGDTIHGKTTDPLKYEDKGNYTITWVYEGNGKFINTQKQEVVVKEKMSSTEISDINVFIYPNPLGDHLNIEMRRKGIKRLIIADNFGDIKIEKKNLENKEVIDVSSLKTGIYTLKLETATDSFSKKLFKK